jgi:hypothetical protein
VKELFSPINKLASVQPLSVPTRNTFLNQAPVVEKREPNTDPIVKDATKKNDLPAREISVIEEAKELLNLSDSVETISVKKLNTPVSKGELQMRELEDKILNEVQQ